MNTNFLQIHLKTCSKALSYSLENARTEEELALWEEEDYCSPPLKEEKSAVLDKYFTGIVVEKVEKGEGWKRIAHLPSLWKS